jgi:hypothetical protein
MRRAHHFHGLQALEAADAVIDMHDKIAGCEAGRLRQEVFGPPFLAMAHQPVAQHVLLGNDGKVVGLETRFQTENN